MTCEQCHSDCRYRTVTLDLGAIGKSHAFCSDACKTSWLETITREFIRALNAIRIHTRNGLHREHATQALKRLSA